MDTVKIHRSMAKLDSIDIFCRDTKTIGQAILCLHGRWGRGETWVDFIRHYGDRYRVIAPDQRGHGLSGKPIAKYTAEEMAGDMVGLLDFLCLDSVILVGHSMGGRIAGYLTALYPNRVKALAILDKSAAGPEKPNPLPLDKIALVDPVTKDWPLPFASLGEAQEFLRKEMESKLSYDYFMNSLVETVDGYQMMFSSRAIAASIAYEENWFHLLPKLKCPVLLVRAKKGEAVSDEDFLKMQSRAIAEEAPDLRGREHDVGEVRNYWRALLRVEEWARAGLPLSEDLIRRLHALVEKGARARPTPYRVGQNAVRDNESNAIVYLPPEAKDVPELMSAIVAWAKHAEREGLPVPVVAALLHYQFVTIHPYYDGNGRAARLLATFILHRGGYGLNGFFSLEEHHARDLAAYYRALAVHPHHNYYAGRAEADLTPWLEYFIAILARVFTLAKEEAARLAADGSPIIPDALRRLDPRARAVVALLAGQERITSNDVARALGLSQRMARELLQAWVKEGWLMTANASNRARAYELSANYRQLVGDLAYIRPPD